MKHADLTEAQRDALRIMDHHRPKRVEFHSEQGQEAVCALDAMGLAAAYTDAGYSMGLIRGGITPAGLRALQEEQK